MFPPDPPNSAPRCSLAPGHAGETLSQRHLPSSRAQTARRSLARPGSGSTTPTPALTAEQRRERSIFPPLPPPWAHQPGDTHLDGPADLGAEALAMHLLCGSAGLRAAGKPDQGRAVGLVAVHGPHKGQKLSLGIDWGLRLLITGKMRLLGR